MKKNNKEKMSLSNYFTKKVLVGLSIIVTLFTIMGSLWALDDRYATDMRVNEVFIRHTSDMEDIEIELAGALENVQQKIDVKHLQFMYDTTSREIFELKRQMRMYPNDEVLKEDYQELLDRKKYFKTRLDEALEKIRVN